MPGIVCAIRGGPASQPTIARSIALAQETGLPVKFLYIVNLDFLSRTTSSRVHTITQEMQQLGEFILLTAQAAAAAQHVAAQGVVRHGNVTEEIIKLCHDVGANYVVLGRPQVHREDATFTHERLAEFSQKLEALTGAKVVLAHGGEA